MPQQLSEMPSVTRPGSGGGNRKYDWDTLTNGQVWEVYQGEDFTCQMDSFQAICSQYATEHQMKVRMVRTSETSWALQFRAKYEGE